MWHAGPQPRRSALGGRWTLFARMETHCEAVSKALYFLPGSSLNKIGPMIMIMMTLSAYTSSKDPAGEARTPPASSNSDPSPWESKLGQLVTVDGEAEDAKLGALLMTGSGMIWIDGLDAWPSEVRGKRLQITGKVIQRSDLPVFVHQEGEPQMQGMPVPAGTDLEKARRRFLLAEARWTVAK